MAGGTGAANANDVQFFVILDRIYKSNATNMQVNYPIS